MELVVNKGRGRANRAPCISAITCNITHMRHHIRIGWAPMVVYFMKNKTIKDINYTLVLIWKTAAAKLGIFGTFNPIKTVKLLASHC